MSLRSLGEDEVGLRRLQLAVGVEEVLREQVFPWLHVRSICIL